MASTRSRRLMEEAKENQNETEIKTLALPPPLSLTRSPLISIPNPSQTPKSAQTTPKSALSRVSSRREELLSPLSEPRGTTIEKTCSRRLLESSTTVGLVQQPTETSISQLPGIGELEAALAGSLRREKIAETEVKSLKAEIKHISRLVHLIENEAQRSQEKLKMREEHIRQLHLLADDLISSDGYLMEENVMLRKEIHLLKDQADSNPQVKKFALENMQLLQQIKMLDNYNQYGERELLLAEISQLRNQLLTVLDWKHLAQPQDEHSYSEIEKQTLADNSEKSAIFNGLEAQIKNLTQENEKLMESIACRDTEWEAALVDLTRFLSNGCDSLQDASDSIESLVSAFPKRESLPLVNGHVERAITASLERERLVHDQREKLTEARRLEKVLKGKLDCLRGSALAMSELHERELLEGLSCPGAQKAMHVSPHEVFLDETPFDKAELHQGELMVMRNSWDLSDTGSSQSLHDGQEFASKESTEVNHVDVTKRSETYTRSAATLLSNFKKVQETMAEAEHILSSLLQATETARGERDSLMESHFLFIEELTYAISSVEELFREIKRITNEGLGEIRSDFTLLVKELKDWVEKSRATIRKKYQETVEKMQEEQDVLKLDISSLSSQLERTKKLCSAFEKDNNELHLILEEESLKRAETEEMLKEKSMVISGLEKEILSMNGSLVKNVEKEKEIIGREREELKNEVLQLKARFDMAMALAEEKEAIAVEAQHVAEISKMHAEEKEQEVELSEHSIGELDATIHILEGKLHDQKEEVESYQKINRHLELQVKVLTDKISFLQNGEGDNFKHDEISRIVELEEAKRYIEDLETEVQYREEEIENYKDHISELVLHSEAQSSLFQEKYKALENMVSSTKSNSQSAADTNPSGEKTEMPLVSRRRPGSPFKCITNMVHQVHMEKEQELYKALNRIHELEALLSAKQQEVCILTARLAAVDTMTHDVIRDLLGVKLDMTNYVNLIDEEQLENLLVKSHQQAEESKAKDVEILNLRGQIEQLFQERASLVEDINQRKAAMLADQLFVEELAHKENLLTTKNKMLKMDKANLQKRILEMDEASSSPRTEEGSSRNERTADFKKRLERSDRLLFGARQEKYLSEHIKACQQLKLKRPSFIDRCAPHE